MIERCLRACRVLLSVFGDHHSILLENLALRQQLAIYHRTVPRPRLRRRDRLFWMGLSRWWRDWKSALVIVRPETVPCQTWRTFLANHLADVSPSTSSPCRPRCSGCPTACWTAQQIVEAFPDDTAPRFLLRDRDAIYGSSFETRVKNLSITDVLTAPRSPWQNAYVERLIGSIRRECLDHVIVLNERRCDDY